MMQPGNTLLAAACVALGGTVREGRVSLLLVVASGNPKVIRKSILRLREGCHTLNNSMMAPVPSQHSGSILLL